MTHTDYDPDTIDDILSFDDGFDPAEIHQERQPLSSNPGGIQR